MTASPNKPEPSPVVRAFGGATVAYECPNCGALHRVHGTDLSDQAKRFASECCGPWFCEKHQVTITQRWGCDICSGERRTESEQKWFASAKKVTLAEYQGEYLYRDGFGNEGYFTDGDVGEDPDEYPEWAFGCEQQTVSEDSCDLSDHVTESILSDHHEDAFDNADVDKIQEASKLIYEALKNIMSYLPDESVVVFLRTPNLTP